MNRRRRQRDVPEARVTNGAYDRLVLLVKANWDHHPAARLLARKLAVARRCAAEDMDADTVTLKCRVRYRVDGDEDAESRILVEPKDYIPTGQFLSVMSPLGVALLGLGKGSEATYRQWNGDVHTLVVEDVAYQPERRFHAAA